VQGFHQPQGVSRPVEDIRIAEGNVPGPSRHLLADVRQHHLRLHNTEPPVVIGNDRAVPAQVVAAAAGLGVSNPLARSVQVQMGVALEQRQIAAVWRQELQDSWSRGF